MTRAMALEWGRFDINVNALCPGYIDTEINHHHWQTEPGQKLVQMLPRKRVGKPEDLDSALLMLCANESHFVNGAVIAGRRRLRLLMTHALRLPEGPEARPRDAHPRALGRPGRDGPRQQHDLLPLLRDRCASSWLRRVVRASRIPRASGPVMANGVLQLHPADRVSRRDRGAALRRRRQGRAARSLDTYFTLRPTADRRERRADAGVAAPNGGAALPPGPISLARRRCDAARRTCAMASQLAAAATGRCSQGRRPRAGLMPRRLRAAAMTSRPLQQRPGTSRECGGHVVRRRSTSARAARRCRACRPGR